MNKKRKICRGCKKNCDLCFLADDLRGNDVNKE